MGRGPSLLGGGALGCVCILTEGGCPLQGPSHAGLLAAAGGGKVLARSLASAGCCLLWSPGLSANSCLLGAHPAASGLLRSPSLAVQGTCPLGRLAQWAGSIVPRPLPVQAVIWCRVGAEPSAKEGLNKYWVMD